MSTVRRMVSRVQDLSLPLMLGVIASLVVANIEAGSYHDLISYNLFGDGVGLFGHELTLHFLINDVFMVFFFGIATKEITESVLPGGALNPPRKAINPLMGTLGGILGPAGLYLLLAYVFYGGSDDFSEVVRGWGIPTATDIALAWLVARLVFGNGHPAVNFLLLLAVADDAIGLGIIAVFYTDPEHPVVPAWLLLSGGGLVVAYTLRRFRVRSWVPYIVIAGTLSWFGLLKSSVEPALALVPIIPFLPASIPGLGPSPAATRQAVHAEREAGGTQTMPAPGHSTLEQFEHRLKLPVDMGLFFFSFANAGVAFGSINAVTLAVLLSLVVGKAVGISAFSGASSMFGFPLPTGMGVKHLVVAGVVAGLGLTVALFVAGKAFAEESPFLEPGKMGAVLSAGAGLLALGLGALLNVRDRAGTPAGKP